jgi:hypothetical protein
MSIDIIAEPVRTAYEYTDLRGMHAEGRIL